MAKKSEDVLVSVRLGLALKILGYDPQTLAMSFGACPKCYSIDGFSQRGRRIVAFCNFHQYKWLSPLKLLKATAYSIPVSPVELHEEFGRYEWVKPFRPALDD